MIVFTKNLAFAAVITSLAVLLVLFIGKGQPSWTYIGIAFISAFPLKIGHKTYLSFWGGAVNGHLYSIFGFYQDSTGDAGQLVGVCSYQRAGGTATQCFGLSLYQSAGQNCLQWAGISFYQRAEGESEQVFGLVFYQSGTKAVQCLGISIVQFSTVESFQGFGICLFQFGGEYAGQVIGCTLTRHTLEESDQMSGLCLIEYAEATRPNKLGGSVLRFKPVATPKLLPYLAPIQKPQSPP